MNIIDPRDIVREEPVEEEVTAETFVETHEAAEEEVLENIEANDEADPTPLVVNAYIIPEDITPTAFIDSWETTGNPVINTGNNNRNLTSGVVYRAMADTSMASTQRVISDDVNVTPAEETEVESESSRRRRGTATHRSQAVEPEVAPEVIIPEETPRPEGMPYGPMTPDNVDRGLYEDHLRKKEIQRKEIEETRRQEHIKISRRSQHYHDKYFMTSDDLMIIDVSGDFEHLHFIKNDTQRKDTIKNLNTRTGPNRVTGDNARYLNNTLMYDKNMNPLTQNYSSYFNVKSDKTFTRINTEGTNMAGWYNWIGRTKWIVVDKVALMRSKGRDFRIKNRTGYTIAEALQMKKSIIDKIDKVEAFITYLRDMVGQVYDQENFEIIYNINFSVETQRNYFYITFQFPDLVVNNSIEMTHDIENMLTRLAGDHNVNAGNEFRSISDLMGLRTKFSPKDMYYGYLHSHLPINNYYHWDYFCMGQRHFMSAINRDNISELDFETILVGMLDHISWESLEGGPYIKMESIGSNSIQNNIPFPTINKQLMVYGPEATKAFFDYLKTIDFSQTFDAFTLKIQNGKEASYNFNERLFVTKFLECLGVNYISNFYHEFNMPIYEYIPSEHLFIKYNILEDRPNNSKDLYKEARNKINKVPIIYMNGKYIRPQLIDEKMETEISQKTIVSIHPIVIAYIANIIHFHLLNELRNVK